jgi:hypothetical protein
MQRRAQTSFPQGVAAKWVDTEGGGVGLMPLFTEFGMTAVLKFA